jgi:RNA polymerase sigma-70 factor (ECF subfamily)
MKEIMNGTNESIEGSGPFEPRYLAFLETIATLRPSLHRYCARMTGSVMDGEDVVQEALFEAYRKLDKFDDSRPLNALDLPNCPQSLDRFPAA